MRKALLNPKKLIAVLTAFVICIAFAVVSVPQIHAASGPAVNNVVAKKSGSNKNGALYTIYATCDKKKGAKQYQFELSSSKNFSADTTTETRSGTSVKFSHKFYGGKKLYVQARSRAKIKGKWTDWTDYGKVKTITPKKR